MPTRQTSHECVQQPKRQGGLGQIEGASLLDQPQPALVVILVCLRQASGSALRSRTGWALAQCLSCLRAVTALAGKCMSGGDAPPAASPPAVLGGARPGVLADEPSPRRPP